MKAITLRLGEGLLAAVDAAAGDVPRERWIRRVLEAASSESGGASASSDSGQVASPRASVDRALVRGGAEAPDMSLDRSTPEGRAAFRRESERRRGLA